MKFLLLFLISLNCFSQIGYGPLYKHTEQEKEYVKIAERLSNEMAHSSSFKKFMNDRGLIKTNGLSPDQVVEHIKNAKLSVPVHMYSKWYSNVVGYRQPPKPDVHTNRKFHAGSTACARASNLMHEWSHSLGYGHSFNANKMRPYTVPYSINKAFSSLCYCKGSKDCMIMDNPVEVKTKIVCKRTWYTFWIKKKCYKKSL